MTKVDRAGGFDSDGGKGRVFQKLDPNFAL